jgi:hypothetical protein
MYRSKHALAETTGKTKQRIGQKAIFLASMQVKVYCGFALYFQPRIQ